jgi:hypothetical protein
MFIRNQKRLSIFLILLSGSAYPMHEKHDAFYWNSKILEDGNTRMHQLVRDLFYAPNQLNSYIDRYKIAIDEGGNQFILNNHGRTAHRYLETCVNYRLLKAIRNHNKKDILELIYSAPELCIKTVRPLEDTPLEYALKYKNIFAQALINSYIQGQALPKNPREQLEVIADQL